MAIKKYRVDTEKGSFEIEVDEPEPPRAVSPDEPGTFTGGVLRSLKDQFLNATVNNPLTQGAAHPQTKADFLNLLIPDAGGALSALSGKAAALGSRVIKGLKLDTPVSDVVRAGARGAANTIDAVGRSGEYVPFLKAGGRQLRKMGTKGASGPIRELDRFKPNISSLPDRGVPQGEMPTSSVDSLMPNQGSISDRGIPQDDELLQALMGDAADPHMPNQSGIPDAGIDQGVMPTSSMSEVDRYMPNRSGVERPTGAGTGGASTPEGSGGTLTPEAVDKLRQVDPGIEAGGGQLGQAGQDAGIEAGGSPEELRRMFGSRDAASQLGMSRGDLLQAAPGPSRTPIDVENKMGDASFDRIINQDPEMQDPMLRALIEQLFGGRKP